MRDLSIVIDQLLEAIPESYDSLRRKLISTQTKLRYAAPETFGYHWLIVAKALETHTLDNEENWVVKSEQIFNNQSPIQKPFGA